MTGCQRLAELYGKILNVSKRKTRAHALDNTSSRAVQQYPKEGNDFALGTVLKYQLGAGFLREPVSRHSDNQKERHTFSYISCK